MASAIFFNKQWALYLFHINAETTHFTFGEDAVRYRRSEVVGFIKIDFGAETTGGGGCDVAEASSLSRVILGLLSGGVATAAGTGGRLIALLGSLPEPVTVVTGLVTGSMGA